MKLSLSSSVVLSLLCLPLVAGAVSCQTTYYKTMAAFGKQKRHLLLDHVEEARQDQDEAEQQFKEALKAFTAVTRYGGAELEGSYNKLTKELATTESRARDVSSGIKSTEQVANDLFAEWDADLAEYSSSDLKASKEAMIRDAKQNYATLITAMKRAEKTMEPVLVVLREQSRSLQHNLNSDSLAALRSKAPELEANVATLEKEMEASIAEANSFLKTMGEQWGIR